MWTNQQLMFYELDSYWGSTCPSASRTQIFSNRAKFVFSINGLEPWCSKGRPSEDDL
jgi:hypothetical protein